MGIGKTLSDVLEERKINPNELSEKTGIAPSTIYSIIKRDNMKVDISVLAKICRALNVSMERFYNEYVKENSDDFSKQIKNDEFLIIKKYRTLDEHGKKMVDFTLDEEYERCIYVKPEEPAQTISIGRSALPASAGAGEFLSEENIEMREFPDCENARRADIVIPVSGDSMEPMFSDGDELYVRLQPAVEAGEIGIFIIEGRGYVKEYAEDRLISLNPDYDDVFPSEYGECRCVGKVLGKV